MAGTGCPKEKGRPGAALKFKLAGRGSGGQHAGFDFRWYAPVIANRLTLQMIFRRALIGRWLICGPNLLGPRASFVPQRTSRLLQTFRDRKRQAVFLCTVSLSNGFCRSVPQASSLASQKPFGPCMHRRKTLDVCDIVRAGSADLVNVWNRLCGNAQTKRPPEGGLPFSI
jgi:hypothetical protein